MTVPIEPLLACHVHAGVLHPDNSKRVACQWKVESTANAHPDSPLKQNPQAGQELGCSPRVERSINALAMAAWHSSQHPGRPRQSCADIKNAVVDANLRQVSQEKRSAKSSCVKVVKRRELRGKHACFGVQPGRSQCRKNLGVKLGRRTVRFDACHQSLQGEPFVPSGHNRNGESEIGRFPEPRQRGHPLRQTRRPAFSSSEEAPSSTP